MEVGKGKGFLPDAIAAFGVFENRQAGQFNQHLASLGQIDSTATNREGESICDLDSPKAWSPCEIIQHMDKHRLNCRGSLFRKNPRQSGGCIQDGLHLLPSSR